MFLSTYVLLYLFRLSGTQPPPDFVEETLWSFVNRERDPTCHF
jgi:hypothetical protein